MKNYKCEVCNQIEPESRINFLEYHEMCAEVVCDDCLKETYETLEVINE